MSRIISKAYLSKLKNKTFDQLRTLGYLRETSSIVVRGEVDHNLNENVLEHYNFRETLSKFLDQFITDTWDGLVKDANQGVKKYTDQRDN